VKADELANLALLGISIVEKVSDIVRSAREGKTSPDDAMKKLQAMHDKLDANNAAADAALREKFQGIGPHTGDE
jgi:hypothetical protein